MFLILVMYINFVEDRVTMVTEYYIPKRHDKSCHYIIRNGGLSFDQGFDFAFNFIFIMHAWLLKNVSFNNV